MSINETELDSVNQLLVVRHELKYGKVLDSLTTDHAPAEYHKIPIGLQNYVIQNTAVGLYTAACHQVF
jgi:hypothetical protein